MPTDLDLNVVVTLKWVVALAVGWALMVGGRYGLSVNPSFVGSASARISQVVGTIVFWAAMIGLAGWALWSMIFASGLI